MKKVRAFKTVKTRPLFLTCTLLLFTVLMPILPAAAEATPTTASNRFKRIVSLSPPITEALYLLGLEKNLVGVTVYCRKPEGTPQKEKVGSVVAPDVEKIISLKPDVVFAMSLTDARQISKLRSLGIKTVIFKIPRTFSELCDIFSELGNACGKRGEALHLINESKKRVLALNNRVKSIPKPVTLVQIGSKPLFVATSDFFLNDYVELAGGVNAFANLKSGAVSFEQAVAVNPDVIIIAGMGISGESERQIWSRFPSVKAVKDNRIFLVDTDKLCSPTPVTFADYLIDIARILHPEVFK